MPRKKQQTKYLSDSTFTFGDTAIVMFRTAYLNYEFVMHLNTTYNLNLSRVIDIEMSDGSHPCFCFYSEKRRLAFVMLEKPATGTPDKSFVYYDKMLLIRGRDAFDMQQYIFETTQNTLAEPDQLNMLEHRRWVLYNKFSQNIFDTDTFSFNKGREVYTSLFDGDFEDMPKPLTAYIKVLKKFLTETFETLEYMLCMDDIYSSIE